MKINSFKNKCMIPISVPLCNLCGFNKPISFWSPTPLGFYIAKQYMHCHIQLIK